MTDATGPLPPLPETSCGCQPEPTLNRRDLLKASGGLLTLAALSGAQRPSVAQAANDHRVPVDKGLDSAWVKSLRLPGTPVWSSGAELNTIGMPCGGIGTGQLYLRGDGTLGVWRIFNRAGGPQAPVEQGFAVVVEQGGQRQVRPLSRVGFPGVEFLGEYPLGRLRYTDPACPVTIAMEVGTPFIPLNAKDSALPATWFEMTVTNTTRETVKVATVGWLENAVLCNTASRIGPGASRRTTRSGARLVHSASYESPQVIEQPREPIMIADFEGADYGTWKATGTAFGERPAAGTLGGQQTVSGFQGKGLVNTFIAGDAPQGTLTSPPIDLNRRFVNFMIGGGSHAGQTCLNLIVDGKVVRTAVGRDNERLEWMSWNVADLEGQRATFEIVDQNSGGWGHINLDHIELADEPRQGALPPFEQLDDLGTMVLALADGQADQAVARAAMAELGEPGIARTFDDEAWPAATRQAGVLASPMIELAPTETQTFTWLIAWHFPNHPNGHEYTTRFADAPAVADFLLANRERLVGETRLWRDVWYDSTLPRWLLDRLHSTVSTLATGTCQWWSNGRFWAWEGVNCCAGTCTHVWNYAHAAARLFPELERSARTMQDFGAGYHDDGLVGFRSNNAYAADGQCGTILKAYREHLASADDAYLTEYWPKIKQALEYSIARDGNDDGLIEDSQHNTYDINFEGPNTFVGSLYLAALKAGAAMAREVGDDAAAERYTTIAEEGGRKTAAELFDGEYFFQQVDLDKYPKSQYGHGCLADQVFGQGWAHHVGLGYIYPEPQVRSALESVWKYCWAPDVGPQNEAHPPQRWFIKPGEPGLFICTWPKSLHLGKNAVLYRDEVWTGIEYQVAGHMVWEGMLDEALVICRAVHDRYAAGKRNPYNEIECGDHYARALASWGVYTALCGYDYHGPKGRLSFAPKLDGDGFRAAFTAAEGWGTFEKDGPLSRVMVKWGRLRLRELGLPAAEGQVSVTLDGKAVAATGAVAEGRLSVAFAAECVVGAGQTLEVSAG